jgi:PmbA protein
LKFARNYLIYKKLALSKLIYLSADFKNLQVMKFMLYQMIIFNHIIILLQTHMNHDHKTIIDKVFSQAKKFGINNTEVVFIEENSISASVRLGKTESIEQSNSSGIGIRAISGQKQAFVSSSDYDDDSICQLVERVNSMMNVSTNDPYLDIASYDNLAKDFTDLNLYDDYQPTIQELIDMALEAENSAMSVKNINNSNGAGSSSSKNKVTMAFSNGFFYQYQSSSFSNSVSVLAGSDDAMESDYDFSSKRFFQDLEQPNIIGKNAGDKTIKRLGAQKIKSCNCPVIFAPNVAKSLLSCFSSAINGASIARGVSFLNNSLNQKIFNNNISIIDDPLIIKALGSKPCDGEGITGKKIELVSNDGILQDYILDLRSAKQLGLKTNSRASRGMESPPSPSSSNLYIQAGTDTPENIIADIKYGIYVTDLFGNGINIVTGDYSQGAFGFLIENGKLTTPINEITIASNLKNMFTDMFVANDLEFKYATNSPTIMIPQMTIAGL